MSEETVCTVQFPRSPRLQFPRRNDEPHAGMRAIYLEFRSAAPRNQVQLVGLAGTAAAGKAFGDVNFNFVPVLVSTAIFVSNGAVRSASMIIS